MGSSAFYIDYNIDVSTVGDEFDRETELRLQELASAHSDIVGAAVSVEKVADTTTYDVHRVQIVVYKRPSDVVVTKQDADPMVALRDALDTLEKQVRESRDKLAQRNTHRDSQIETIYYDLSADEIYATYAKGWQPILDQRFARIRGFQSYLDLLTVTILIQFKPNSFYEKKIFLSCINVLPTPCYEQLRPRKQKR